MARLRYRAMRTPLKLLLLAALAGSCGATPAADLYVVCNARVSISAADVRDMFLGEKQFAGTIKLVPIDNSAAQQVFLDKVLQMNAAKYSTAWTKKSFRDGVNPPQVAGSDAEALAFVRRTPGACSYVSAPASDVVVVSKQ
ncbi:MAG TPA: phosphate ABC transporter substrate-binding protein [Candidatus Dormibacteraeota bacterium]|nr:phosphate ABC transporter substrate-binding protein [Candidatus Dormibacteraeota bacterium]